MPKTEKREAKIKKRKISSPKTTKPISKRKTDNSKPKTASRAKLFSFKDLNGIHQKLTQRQHDFVIEYLQNYGNSAKAVIESGYDVFYRDRKGNITENVNYNVARNIASENLRKPNILAYIRLKYADFGFDDDNVEVQHLFLINQNDSLPAKQKAISDWYKLKDRYPAEKHEVNGKIDVIELTSFGSKEEKEDK